MSYSLFLILFVCVPTAALLFVMRTLIRWIHLLLIAIIVLIMVIYGAPWTNYLVASGVWYYDPRLLLNIKLGYAPLETYLFFVLQTLLTGLFVFWLWQRFYPQDFAEKSQPPDEEQK
jgi:lycopene cyclase domain-containing protein